MPEGNPFFHRGPVSDPAFFFGRSREGEYLFQLLRKGQSVAVSGPRRIGKTSLLMHLKDPSVTAAHGFPHEETTFLLLDGGTLDGLEEDGFFGAVDRACGGEADSIPYTRFLERLRAIFSPPSRKRLVVFLDEFELIASNPKFGLPMFNRLRGLAAQYPIQFVTASKIPLWRLSQTNPETFSSPFFNIFAPVALGPLEEAESRRMLQDLSAKAGKAFTRETIDWVMTLCGTHPLFLQVAGYRAFESASGDGEIPSGARPQIRNRLLADLEPHLQYYWNELGPEDRYALTALPISGGSADNLAEAGLVRDGRYMGAILEQFVRRQKMDGLLQGGPFLIDLRRNLASVNGRAVHLTPTEFSLLRIFLERPGRLLTAQEIETALWPGEVILDPERARGVVKKLRNALGETGECIVNRRGQGYLLSLE